MKLHVRLSDSEKASSRDSPQLEIDAYVLEETILTSCLVALKSKQRELSIAIVDWILME